MAKLLAKVKTLIRRPVAEVFDAFVDPDKITRFWLRHASGPLRPGEPIEWAFMVPGAKERVSVAHWTENERIEFRWLDGRLDVDIRFARGVDTDTAVISVEVRGFEDGPDGIPMVINATEGFSLVLSDLKVLMETGRSPNLVADKAALITLDKG